MKKIGIGYENYKRFIDENMYYVDKTPLIRNIVEMGGKVTLFTRPRRFGKTLALSMLQTFFEKEYDSEGNAVDNLWGFLFFTGYMRKVSERTEGDDVFLTMRIPNREVRSIYRNQIGTWFEKQIKDTKKVSLTRRIGRRLHRSEVLRHLLL